MLFVLGETGTLLMLLCTSRRLELDCTLPGLGGGSGSSAVRAGPDSQLPFLLHMLEHLAAAPALLLVCDAGAARGAILTHLLSLQIALLFLEELLAAFARKPTLA